MQGCRCAYCESSLEQAGRHIEHFYQKADDQFPQKTFDWDNLFGSCNRNESCGRHKDNNTTPDFNHLIKPDIENPEYYFQFLMDGRITLRDNLTETECHKAEETLRVFNLNPEHGPLKNMRKIHIISHYPDIDFLDELAFLHLFQEIQEFIQKEKEAIRGKPFETAIKHSLFSSL
jgi:uncharacterized protein (TIGR02646 family)